jgi:hypothetical protein
VYFHISHQLSYQSLSITASVCSRRNIPHLGEVRRQRIVQASRSDHDDRCDNRGDKDFD